MTSTNTRDGTWSNFIDNELLLVFVSLTETWSILKTYSVNATVLENWTMATDMLLSFETVVPLQSVSNTCIC